MYVGEKEYGVMGGEETDEAPFGCTFLDFGAYGVEIKRLVARCSNWWPDDRPTLLELRQRIEEFPEANPGMRDDTACPPLDWPELKHGFNIGHAFEARRREI